MNETVEPSSTPEPLDHANALLECLKEGRAGGKRYKYKSVLPFLYELRALVTIILQCSKSGPMGPYLKAARWIPAGINPFIDPRGMVYDGMRTEFSHDQG
jgi:hypothetical protein